MDLLCITMGILGGILGGLIASYVFPTFREIVDSVLSFVSHGWDPNRCNLSATWEYEFSEPDPKNPGVTRKDRDKVKINHVGNFIWATGETQKDKRTFNYRLRVVQNLIFGTYKKVAKKGVTSGTGVVQLAVNPNCDRMVGYTTWMDSDSNQIESCEVEWNRLN